MREIFKAKTGFFPFGVSTGAGGGARTHILLMTFLFMTVVAGHGCMMASMHRKSADKSAHAIVAEKEKQVFGNSREFSIERPGDILRRRLLIEQDLPYAGQASLGTDALEQIAHWPEKEFPAQEDTTASKEISIEKGTPLMLSLVQALQVGAMNSGEYQTTKEKVFQAALELDLQRHNFGFTLDGEASSQISKYQSSTGFFPTSGMGSDGNQFGEGEAGTTVTNSGTFSINKALKNGATIAAAIGIDLVNLLTGDRTFTKSLRADTSISIPLLRGAGKHIAAEALTQAERNVIYALYELETYKKTFAVDVVTSYLNVLQQKDQVENAAENYKKLKTSSLRTKRLADAGRTTVIQVNQAVQEELTARARWISAMEMYEDQLDSFKTLIGLPTDGNVELEGSELAALSSGNLKKMIGGETEDAPEQNGSAATELVAPGRENAGPLEVEEAKAIQMAFENRLDLRQMEEKVVDAQRAVVIAADNLRAELTLLGTGQIGQSSAMGQGNTQNTGSTTGGSQSGYPFPSEDSGLNLDDASYTGLLTLNLPLERTSERNAYRNSYITLEQAVRNVQTLEDSIKTSIRQSLRKMSEARESLKIQSKAVAVAENRGKSTSMFFEAGRAELRDLLEAQASLLTARNALTSAVVDYRVAELSFQRDAGILKIDGNGLLVEYSSMGE